MHDGRINYGANSYTIDEAMVGVGTTDRTDGFLFFGLNRAFPSADRARLTLHIGSDKFAFSEAHYESSTHTYHWRNTGLDWSSTASVTPRLRASPAAPTAVTATASPRTGGLRQAPGRRAIRPHRPPGHRWAVGSGVVGTSLGYRLDQSGSYASELPEGRPFQKAGTDGPRSHRPRPGRRAFCSMPSWTRPPSTRCGCGRGTPSAGAPGRRWRRRAPGRSRGQTRS